MSFVLGLCQYERIVRRHGTSNWVGRTPKPVSPPCSNQWFMLRANSPHLRSKESHDESFYPPTTEPHSSSLFSHLEQVLDALTAPSFHTLEPRDEGSRFGPRNTPFEHLTEKHLGMFFLTSSSVSSWGILGNNYYHLGQGGSLEGSPDPTYYKHMY